MRCVWAGSSGAPANNATNYQHLTATQLSAWNPYENNLGGFNGKSTPLTENIVITKLTVWVATAPGGATAWTFKVRNNALDTAASLTISAAATTGSWTGQVACSINDLVNLSSAPTGAPAGAVNTYWTIEYYTTGNFYLVPVSSGGPGNGNSTNYYTPFGGSFQNPSTVATDLEAVIPTALTVTKLAVVFDQAAAGTATYTIRNNTTSTDSSFSVVLTTSVQGISSTGSLAFSPGDCIVLKEVRSGTNWGAIRSCMTVAPSFAGEIVQAFGSIQAPSTSAVNYNTPIGVGNNAWNATESVVYMRMPASTISKLYVKLTTAPGAAKSYALTVRSNSASTVVAATVSGAGVTTANNTTNTVPHSDGNFFSMMITPTGTPASTAGVKFGFVQVVHQRSKDFFSTF